MRLAIVVFACCSVAWVSTGCAAWSGRGPTPPARRRIETPTETQTQDPLPATPEQPRLPRKPPTAVRTIDGPVPPRPAD